MSFPVALRKDMPEGEACHVCTDGQTPVIRRRRITPNPDVEGYCAHCNRLVLVTPDFGVILPHQIFTVAIVPTGWRLTLTECDGTGQKEHPQPEE